MAIVQTGYFVVWKDFGEPHHRCDSLMCYILAGDRPCSSERAAWIDFWNRYGITKRSEKNRKKKTHKVVRMRMETDFWLLKDEPQLIKTSVPEITQDQQTKT